VIHIRKHIAVFLLGIFCFPIIFQSVHIVWHHSHGYKQEYKICDKGTSEKTSYSFAKNISQKENICPICEYQFSINDLPKNSVFRTIIPEIACLLNEIAVQQQYNQIFSDKTPRAPPVVIS
jgi:hypothetical protein